MDGNFTAVTNIGISAHTISSSVMVEFYMTEPHRYKAHLAIAQEIKEVCYLILFHLSADSTIEINMQ